MDKNEVWCNTFVARCSLLRKKLEYANNFERKHFTLCDRSTRVEPERNPPAPKRCGLILSHYERLVSTLPKEVLELFLNRVNHVCREFSNFNSSRPFLSHVELTFFLGENGN